MHFNVLDLAIYGIITISVLAGFYQGLIATSVNAAGFFVSLLSAKLFYTGMAFNIAKSSKLIDTLMYYSETSEMLGTVEVARTPAASMTPDSLNNLLTTVKLPHPINQWYSHNVLNAVYANQGATTLGDYLSRTVADTAVSIGCFLIILLSVYIIFTIVLNIVHYTVKLPALRLFDGISGGIVGLLRGIFIAMALCLILPSILSILPVQQIRDIVSNSHLAGFYYQHNFMFNMIRSFIS